MSVKSLSITKWGNTMVIDALQLTCVWSGVLVFPVSASVASKQLLWLKKQRKGRWPKTMKLGKWGPKTHLQLLIIAIGAAKDNKIKKDYNLMFGLLVNEILISQQQVMVFIITRFNSKLSENTWETVHTQRAANGNSFTKYVERLWVINIKSQAVITNFFREKITFHVQYRPRTFEPRHENWHKLNTDTVRIRLQERKLTNDVSVDRFWSEERYSKTCKDICKV